MFAFKAIAASTTGSRDASSLFGLNKWRSKNKCVVFSGARPQRGWFVWLFKLPGVCCSFTRPCCSLLLQIRKTERALNASVKISICSHFNVNRLRHKSSDVFIVSLLLAHFKAALVLWVTSIMNEWKIRSGGLVFRLPSPFKLFFNLNSMNRLSFERWSASELTFVVRCRFAPRRQTDIFYKNPVRWMVGDINEALSHFSFQKQREIMCLPLIWDLT